MTTDARNTAFNRKDKPADMSTCRAGLG
jgi:hypothetical protein